MTPLDKRWQRGLSKDNLGTSLAVQWLGLGAVTAVARVQSLVGEPGSHKICGAAKKKKKNLNTLRPCLNPCQSSHFTSCETTHARLLPLPRSSGHAVLACAP